jgi:methionyl aminopeptidase
VKTDMPIELKTREQIAIMREAGRIVAEVYEVLRPHVVPGVTTLDLDRMAEEYILKRGALPVYKGYVPAGGQGIPPFPGTICASVNEVICQHPQPGTPEEGDIIGVDTYQVSGLVAIHADLRGGDRCCVAASDGRDEAQPGSAIEQA